MLGTSCCFRLPGTHQEKKPLFSLELGPFPTTQSFPFPLSLGFSSGYRMQLLAKQQKEWWKGLGEADEAIPGEERHLLVVPSQMCCRQRPQTTGSLGAELRLRGQTDPDSGPSICHDVLCVSRQDSCSERRFLSRSRVRGLPTEDWLLVVRLNTEVPDT